MDTLVALVLAAKPTAVEWRELNERLTKAEALLTRSPADALAALSSLDFTEHSLAVCHILAATAGSRNTGLERSQYIDAARTFFAACQVDQIRLAPAKFVRVSRTLATLSIELHTALPSVLPLRTAARKLAPGPNTLTACHVDFLQVALVAKAYKAAGAELDRPMFEVMPKKVLTGKDVVLFFYYGGMVYTGLKQFERAMEFYKMCIGTAASVVSAVVVEAAKKFLLPTPYLPCTPATVASALPSLLTSYNELAAAYKSLDAEALSKASQSHFELFNSDSNWGLVKQVVASLTRRKILRLTNAYITRSLDDIAAATGLAVDKAEALLLEMIERREIIACIDKSNGMVSFSDDPEEYDSAAMAAKLDADIRTTMDLADRVSKLDAVIAMTDAYAMKVAAVENPELARGGRGAGAAAGAGGSGSAGWGGDHDMMGEADFSSVDLLVAKLNVNSMARPAPRHGSPAT